MPPVLTKYNNNRHRTVINRGEKTRSARIIAGLMLITIFGVCFIVSADGLGIIKVQVKFLRIPIPNAEV